MSAVLHAADKETDPTNRTPNQCNQILKDAAVKMSILPEQLRACRRESMQQTARKIAFVVWPEPTTRSDVNAKTIDRDVLDLIYSKGKESNASAHRILS